MEKNTKGIKAFLHDAKAVSPAIATLILIVIAAVAAAGVGILVQSSQKNAQDQTANKDMSAMGTLYIKGSTTILPIVQTAAPEFAKKYPAIDLKVSGGGSGIGKYTAWTTTSPTEDIGAVSAIWTAETVNGVNIPSREEAVISLGGQNAKVTETKIGTGMIVVAGKMTGPTCGAVTSINVTNAAATSCVSGVLTLNFTELKGAYTTGTPINVDSLPLKVIQRSDPSGTEETFAKWIGNQGTDKQLATATVTAIPGYQGNQGVRDAIAEATSSAPVIGFLDVGFTGTNVNGNVNVLAGTMNGVAASLANKGVGGPYDSASDVVNGAINAGLARDLYFYTQGTPTGAVSAWLNWIMTSDGQKIVQKEGFFSN